MEEMGLAQAQQAQGMQQRGRPAGPMDINQIIAMLMQGVEPEELVEQGVPQELVMAAIEQISKQMTQVPNEQAGLANMMVQPERGM